LAGRESWGWILPGFGVLGSISLQNRNGGFTRIESSDSLLLRPRERGIRCDHENGGTAADSHLGDFIEDKNAILPIDAAIQSNLRETTTRALASLTPREERIVRMRFGIGMNTDHTLEEVGQQFSVTRERRRR
jgi:hypothetical protein